MAVYVDDMNLQAGVPEGRRAGRARGNHLFADTEEELRAFAAKIGVKAEWIQDPGGRHAHFDVTTGKRQQAIANGATEGTWGAASCGPPASSGSGTRPGTARPRRPGNGQQRAAPRYRRKSGRFTSGTRACPADSAAGRRAPSTGRKPEPRGRPAHSGKGREQRNGTSPACV